MVKCPRCGYENDTTDIYCRNCTYPLQDPNTNYRTKRKRDSSWNISTGKKVILVVGIIVISLLLFSVVYNMTQPTPQNSLNVVTYDGSTLDSEDYPYQINIITNGSWEGKVGNTKNSNHISGTGSKMIRIHYPSWEDIVVSIEKDYSSSPLTVQLIKNDRVIAENSTSTPGATVSLNNFK